MAVQSQEKMRNRAKSTNQRNRKHCIIANLMETKERWTMALAYDGAIQRLIDAFAHLPGIGPKGAQRCHDESSLFFLIALHGFQRVCDGLHAIASCPTIRDASAARRRNLKIALSEFVIAGVQSQ